MAKQESVGAPFVKTLSGVLKYLFIALVVTSLVGSILTAFFFIYFAKGLPSIITIEDYKPLTVTRVYSRDNVVVGEYFEEKRYLVPMESVPDHLQNAFVASEDDRFFDHQGVDLQGILRAAIANFKAGKVVQGGSTITQQVAKSLLLTPERSFVRKIKEVILANRMEKNLNKKQILYLYLNQIYLGHGAYGVEAAARTYFNKPAKELSIAESAMLAGMPQAPGKYSPLLNPKFAKQRQQYVLRRMFESGMITQPQMESEMVTPLKISNEKDFNDTYAPYYVEYIRKYLLDKYGKDALYREGMTIKSPVDAQLSLVAKKAVRDGLRNVDKKHGYRGPIKHCKNEEECKQVLDEVVEFNLNVKYPYKVLLPDGTLSIRAADKIPSGTPELDLFEENEIYQGIVSQVDDAKKEVTVNLGFLKGVIGLDQMRWAQLVKVPSSTGIEEIKRPSQALRKNDVIWVKLLKKEGSKNLSLALEQNPMVQGSLLSVDVNTGEVLAMVGGFDFKESEFNRAVQAERQMGSVYKPVIYSAAIDKGYTPVTLIQDSPIVFDAGENEKWKPENYEEKFYGDTTFRSALIKSRNIPTIKIVQDIQIPYLIDYSKRLGLPDKFNHDLSIALGSSTASLLDVVSVYSIFPRGGRKLKPIFITQVVDRNGKVLEENKPVPQPAAATYTPLPTPKVVTVAGQLLSEANSDKADPNRGAWTGDPADPDRVMDTRTAYVMTHLMNEVATVGTGHEAKNPGRAAAGKTGTTNDFLDAWFVGFSPSISTGVWVGFDTQKSLGPKSAGAIVALPIWLEFMKEAVKNTPDVDFSAPQGVTFAYIDSISGRASTPNRPNATKEAFISGTEPGASSGTVAPTNQTTSNIVSSPGASPEPADTDTQDFFKEDIQ